MSDFFKENGYIRNHAIIAAFNMSQFLFKRNHKHPDAWFFIAAGADLNKFQFLRVRQELTTY